MICAVVASSKMHAAAIIKWLKLDPTTWVPIAYGDRIDLTYECARLVRPLSGVTDRHLDWVISDLIPHVCVTPTAIPQTWRLSKPDSE
jgi:hypothetical protein